MKRKTQQIVEILSELDNTSLAQIALKFSKIIENREAKLIQTMKNKDINGLSNLSHFFKTDYLPLDAVHVLAKLDYNKTDREFINYLFNPDNFSVNGATKEKILYQYLSKSLLSSEFYHEVKNDFPKEIKNVISINFSKNSLCDVSPEIFLNLMQSCDFKISMSNFKDYVKNESLPILKLIIESNVFCKFITINQEKIKNLALLGHQEDTARYIINTFNYPKQASFFFNDDNSAENFCKKSNMEFFTYIINEFDFENDQKNMVFLMHHLGKTNSPQKWKTAIDCLVKNHIDNPEFIEQIKRKIETSKIEEYKGVARQQFQYSFLDATLNNKEGKSKTMKI